MSLNKVMIMGRLGQDPELKYTPSGQAVCNFSVATSEGWTDKSGQKQERTEWHRIVVWGKMAELCNQYLSKGRQCFLEGALQTRSWDAKDGSKRYTTEIVARNVQFIGGRPNAEQGGGEYNQSAPSTGGVSTQQNNNSVIDQDYQIPSDSNFTADDIPF
ncbi:MAG: single-stranded DNA-binding protein [Bacteriovoracaceae bacterium]